jgi:4-hydroxybenzoate polyprenyltransferase
VPEVTRAPGSPHPAPLPSERDGRPALAAGAAAAAAPLEQFTLLIQGMRPRQWSKNLLLFAGVTFSGRLLDPVALARACLAFAVFCLLSGATYLFNDLVDLQRDRIHPTKRLRPLASGRLAPRTAQLGIVAALVLAAALIFWMERLPATLGSWRLVSLWPLHLRLVQGDVAATRDAFAYSALGGSGLLFTLTALAYVVLMVAYTLWLKHIVLLDVFTIAAGFVLRAMAGAFAVAVRISPWLYLCTILLALFLVLGKRRQELILLDRGAGEHRRILSEYSPQLLDQLITIVTSATIMAYSLYTVQGPTGDQRLMVTIPFVLYGIFRYLYLVYVRGEGGSPEEVLLRDPHVRWCVILCMLTIGVVLYVIPA